MLERRGPNFQREQKTGSPRGGGTCHHGELKKKKHAEAQKKHMESGKKNSRVLRSSAHVETQGDQIFGENKKRAVPVTVGLVIGGLVLVEAGRASGGAGKGRLAVGAGFAGLGR
jgi:hypothetical protein